MRHLLTTVDSTHRTINHQSRRTAFSDGKPQFAPCDPHRPLHLSICKITIEPCYQPCTISSSTSSRTVSRWCTAEDQLTWYTLKAIDSSASSVQWIWKQRCIFIMHPEESTILAFSPEPPKIPQACSGEMVENHGGLQNDPSAAYQGAVSQCVASSSCEGPENSQWYCGGGTPVPTWCKPTAGLPNEGWRGNWFTRNSWF